MKRLTPLIATIAAMGLVAFLILYRWFELPNDQEQIEERWDDVNRLARSHPSCLNDDEHLLSAIGYRTQKCLADLRNGIDREKLPPGEVLPPRALSDLITWDEEEGGLGHSVLISYLDGNPEHDSLLLLHISKEALAAATDDPADPLVSAVLRISWLLRECGASFDASVGYSIAEIVLERHLKKNISPSPSFVRYAPTQETVIGIFAREEVQSHQLDAGILASISAEGLHQCLSFDHCMLRLTPIDKELLMLKQHRATFINEMAKVSPELGRMRDVIRATSERQPKSALLRWRRPIYEPLDEMLTKVGKIVETHEQYMKRHSVTTSQPLDDTTQDL